MQSPDPTIVLYVHESTPHIEQLVRRILPSVRVVMALNDQIDSSHITQSTRRVGFIYDNRLPWIPFGTSSTHWFGKGFDDFLAQHSDTPIDVDLITCTLDTPEFKQEVIALRRRYPLVQINYSTKGLTKGSTKGLTKGSANGSDKGSANGVANSADWIMESDGEDIKSLYFDGTIAQWQFVLGGNADAHFESIGNAYSHSAIIRTGGTLWTCGNNARGQLGLSDEFKSFDSIDYFRQVPNISGVKSVSCGGLHTAIILDTGELWTCGANDEGQLGNNLTTGLANGSSTMGNRLDILAESYTFVRAFIPNGRTVKSVSCGAEYTMVILDNSSVWGCGWAGNGAIGVDPTTGSTPEFVQSLDSNENYITGAKKIACGGNHTLVLLTDDTVMSSGSNAFGQLGDTSGDRDRFKKIQGITSTNTSIACGMHHTAILGSDGQVLTCGYNYFGQLGRGLRIGVIKPPNEMGVVGNLQQIQQIACGAYNTYALDSDGALWACGANDMYQAGITPASSPIYASYPTQPRAKNSALPNVFVRSVVPPNGAIVQMSGGANYLMLLMDNGTIYGCGTNTMGQLAMVGISVEGYPVEPYGIAKYYQSAIHTHIAQPREIQLPIQDAVALFDTNRDTSITPLCLHPMTRIRTTDGIKPIQHINANDTCYSADQSELKIRANVQFTTPTDRFTIITRGSLGRNTQGREIPYNDLLITDGHPLLLGGKEVDPVSLHNGTTIRPITLDYQVRVYTLCTKQRTTCEMEGVDVLTYEIKDFLERTNDARIEYTMQ